MNETAKGIGSATVQEVKKSVAGLGEAKSWLSEKEWRIPCVDVTIRL